MRVSADGFRIGDFVNSGVLDTPGEYAGVFKSAQPFRHVVIDNFLTDEFCDALCENFPEFLAAHAINENKQVGGKKNS